MVFSYLGFVNKEITVTSEQLDVLLEEDTNELDEVVVTAFGVEKKEKSLGYSVTKVNTEDVIAPLAALTPYKAVAAAPFNTL